MLEVTIGSVINRRLRRTVTALLDTGADITAIPTTCVNLLRLYPIAELQLEGINAGTTRVFLYAVRLVVGDLVVPRHEVIVAGFDFAVIGRDVLNRVNLHLYGPQLAFEIN
jgi:hypothetical protein